MTETRVTSSAQETEQLGEAFAKKLRIGDVVALFGELGSGKTTFVQGLSKGLGVRRRIISPTFIIVRSYELKTQNSKLKTTAQSAKLFYHVDLYRIEDRNELQGLGLQEILRDKDSIVAIEWAQKMGEFLPEDRWDIRFDFISEEKRELTIQKLE